MRFVGVYVSGSVCGVCRLPREPINQFGQGYRPRRNRRGQTVLSTDPDVASRTTGGEGRRGERTSLRDLVPMSSPDTRDRPRETRLGPSESVSRNYGGPFARVVHTPPQPRLVHVSTILALGMTTLPVPLLRTFQGACSPTRF